VGSGKEAVNSEQFAVGRKYTERYENSEIKKRFVTT